MDAVKKIAISSDPDNFDYSDLGNAEFENVGDLEGNEKYEKIKFNDVGLYQIDIAPYLEYVEVVLDEPIDSDSDDDDDNGIEEGFYNFYYRGE